MGQFIFEGYTSDISSNMLSFQYCLRNSGETYHFTETLILPDRETVSITDDLLDKLLQTVHLVLGLSYWKTYCPKEITINGYSLASDEALFWKNVYTKGLGEFYYRNSIDFHGLVTFPIDSGKKSKTLRLSKRNRFLVGVGGGKDSILTAEILKNHDVSFDGFVVETQKSYPLIDTILASINTEAVRIKRIIDPQLFTLNKQDGVYNGHIPISAVYACIGLLASALYGYDGMITSNERSADYGNVKYLGETVNHQWSKSGEFEAMLQEYINNSITPDLMYFSLLRPYSEYSIVERFSKYPKYFSGFSSCNRNFNITKHDTAPKWCGTCPKCAFVYALLSGFITKKELTDIFNADLYSNPDLIPLFQELLGLSGYKPFECVGTPKEVKLAMAYASEKGEYKESPVMKMFEREVLPTLDQDALEKEVTHIDRSVLPEQFQKMV